MSGAISSLFVELKLQAENFNNGLREAQREAKEFEKTIKPSMQVAKDFGLAMTAAGTAIVGGMLAASKSAIDYGDVLNDARQRTGATVETLAKLGFAAEQSGSSFEGLSTGLKFLSKNMEAAIDKGGEQRSAFNALGISSRDLAAAHGDMNKVFLLVADRFKELPDGAEKSALSMKIFGKSGADLIPVLNEGSAGIRKLGEDAQKAGLVVSQDFASASDQLNDTLNKVKAAAMGASVGIAEALLPSLQSAASFAADAGASFAQFAKEHENVTKAALALGAALAVGGTLLLGVAALGAALPVIATGLAAVGGAMTLLSGTAIVALAAAFGALVIAMGQAQKAAENLDEANRAQAFNATRAVDALKAHGIALDTSKMSADEATQAIAKAGAALVDHTKSAEASSAALKVHKISIEDETKAAEAAKKAHEELAKAREVAYRSAYDASHRALEEMKQEGEDAIGYWTKIYQASLDAKIKALGTISSIIDRNRDQLARGLEEEQANSAKWLAHLSQDYVKTLDDQTKADKDRSDQIQKMNQANAEYLQKTAAEFSRSWSQAMGNVTSGIAQGLADALLGAKSFHDSMVSVFQQTARGMLSAFIGGFISPLTNELGKLGATLSKTLFGGGGAGSLGLASALGPIGGGIAAALGGFALVSSLFKSRPPAQTSFYDSGSSVPSYDVGTPYVPSTGPAIVHQGERVVTASDNESLAGLLMEIRDAVRAGSNIYIDGKELARNQAGHLYNLTRNEGVVIVGSR